MLVNDVGRTYVNLLISLVNKETALAHLIGQPLSGWSRQNRMLGRREVSLDTMLLLSRADAMKLQPKMDTGQTC